jgi:hypothetical protein
VADQFHTNTAPADPTTWWIIWQLVNDMISAGYVIVASGDGTTYGVDATNRWATFGGCGYRSWIVLHHPGLNFEIMFWRLNVDGFNGKIAIGKQQAFSVAGFVGAGAQDPGADPATIGYLRGSNAAYSAWMGAGGYVPSVAQIGVKDVAGAGLGAWFILGCTSTYGANTWGHSLRFSALDPYASDSGVDPEPYAFQGPPGATTDYGSYDLNQGNEFTSDSAAGTSGYWWGYRVSGAWAQFGPLLPMQTGSSQYGFSLAPIDTYSAGTKYFLDRYALIKAQTGAEERKGWVKSFRIGALSLPQYDTEGALLWAKFGNGTGHWIVFWDGVTATPHG